MNKVESLYQSRNKRRARQRDIEEIDSYLSPLVTEFFSVMDTLYMLESRQELFHQYQYRWKELCIKINYRLKTVRANPNAFRSRLEYIYHDVKKNKSLKREAKILQLLLFGNRWQRLWSSIKQKFQSNK